MQCWLIPTENCTASAHVPDLCQAASHDAALFQKVLAGGRIIKQQEQRRLQQDGAGAAMLLTTCLCLILLLRLWLCILCQEARPDLRQSCRIMLEIQKLPLPGREVTLATSRKVQ